MKDNIYEKYLLGEGIIMAIALSGCVIVDNGSSLMKYKKKCERCGYILPGTVSMAQVKGKYSQFRSGFRCPKCGTQNKVLIQGE